MPRARRAARGGDRAFAPPRRCRGTAARRRPQTPPRRRPGRLRRVLSAAAAAWAGHEAPDEREVPQEARHAAGTPLEPRRVPDPLRPARQELLAAGETVEAVARRDERLVVQPPRELVPADRDARVAPRLVEGQRAVE